jgi:CDP-diacylglycerol--serine O-phosphatidyltransferase
MRLFEPIPLRVLPPNAITACGMVVGFVSILSSAAGAYETAAWLIAVAALIDKLDGTAARLLKATSEFGVQFDSFSDFCTFGLAPAALLWFAAPTLAPSTWTPPAAQAGLAAICAVYAVCAAVRLARFNVTTAEHPTLFLGLPSTLSGSLIALTFLSAVELGVDTQAIMRVFPYLLVLCAALMVSNLPLPKLRLPDGLAGRIFFVANAVAIYVLVPLRVAFGYALLVLVGYVLVGFVLGMRRQRAAGAVA